jgi:hypothetical protein
MTDHNWSDEIAAYDWDRGPGFPDTDAAHPFPDGNSAAGWGTSSSSTFAKQPGMAGFSGLPVNEQPDQ